MLINNKIKRLRNLITESLEEIKSIREKHPMLLGSDPPNDQSLRFNENAGKSACKDRSINDTIFNLPNRPISKISKIDHKIFQKPSKLGKITVNQDSQNLPNTSNSKISDITKSSIYIQRKEERKNKLLRALLDIIENDNEPVEPTLKFESIKDTDYGIKNYSRRLHEHFEILPDKQSRVSNNNFLRLLFKIGEFTIDHDCAYEFSQSLDEFESNLKYKYYFKLGSILYQIWHPFPDSDLLKMRYFCYYWLDKLSKNDIKHLREQIH